MYRNKRSGLGLGLLISAVCVVGVVFVGISFAAPFVKNEVRGVKITKSERKVSGDSSRYMIFTKDEVFENTDSIINWKFNSDDFYANLNVDDDCDFVVTGWRIPALSMNRNIIDYDCE